MRNLTGGVCLAILAASFAGGYGSRGCADASRRDSLRVALTQLEDATERSEIQDTLLAGMAWTQARTADSLAIALRRTTIRVVRYVDTLQTFVLPEGAQAFLDSLLTEVGTLEGTVDSLVVSHREEVRLYALRIVAKDSLIREWRTLAQRAVVTLAPGKRRAGLGAYVGYGCSPIGCSMQVGGGLTYRIFP
jgi:hypothetical protein